MFNPCNNLKKPVKSMPWVAINYAHALSKGKFIAIL